MALPPVFLMAPTVSAPSAISATTTLAPWAANLLLKACPIPLAPPVTTARLLVGISGILPMGSLVPATWFSALTVNIQKLDNFQNNSRGRANLSSAYRRAAGKAPGHRSRTWARPAKELGDGVL
jgi:hypothetical protein